MDGGQRDGDQRTVSKFVEAKKSRGALRELLSEPMRKQHFGKFRSGVGLQKSIAQEQLCVPYIVDDLSAADASASRKDDGVPSKKKVKKMKKASKTMKR
jgi:hypothetical protein